MFGERLKNLTFKYWIKKIKVSEMKGELRFI